MRILFGEERVQFDAALRARNLVPPKDVIADGRFHRCDARSRNGKGDGSYVAFADGTIPAGGICNWQDGLGFEAWRYQPHGRHRTASEDAEADRKVDEARKRRDAQVAVDHKRTAGKAERLWESAEPATAEHPYLARKRIQPHGTRVLYGCLVVPLCDADGNVHSMQFIGADGEKRFLKGGAKRGRFFQVRGRDDVIYIAEGFATAASIHEVTGSTVVIALDCGNMEPVAELVRQKNPAAEIVVCADDDWKTACTRTGNPGLHGARAAAGAIDAAVVIPDFSGKADNRRDKDTDFNDLANFLGVDAVRRSLSARVTPDQCLARQLNAEPFDAVRPAIAKELADLRLRDRGAFAKLRISLRKAGVRSKLLDEAVDEAEEEDPEPVHQKQVDVLLSLVRGNDVELFHTEDKTAYAAITVSGHREVHAVKSTEFRRWMRDGYFDAKKSSPSGEAMTSAGATIDALAVRKGKCREVHMRVAELDGKFYVDLCDDRWRAVEVSTAGWAVVADSPVLFRRKAGMLPLPVPVTGGSVELLRQFLNIHNRDDDKDNVRNNDDDFVLVVSFLVTALSPNYPYPVLATTGVQGAAKSWTSELLRLLVDPNSVALRVLPHDARSLYIQAQGSHLMCFNNISHIPTWISDGLSCIVDGDGFSARALFTDSDEMLFGGAHPMILNGIEDFVVRPDLAERTVAITLQEIDEDKRQEKKELRRRFNEVRPLILGALLDVMAHGLRRRPGLQVGHLPRLADFAKWAIACETAAFPAGAFMAAFTRNRAETNRIVLEADAVAQGVLALMRLQPEGWQGTATDLLGALKTVVSEETVKEKGWPKAANALSGRLRRATPDLRKAGISVRIEDVGHAKVRTIFLSCRIDKPRKSSTASTAAPSDNDFNGLDAGDDAVDSENDQPASAAAAENGIYRTYRASPATTASNPLENNGAGDAADAVDDFRPVSTRPEHKCQQCNATDGKVLKYRSDGGWVHLHAVCRPFWLKAQRSPWR